MIASLSSKGDIMRKHGLILSICLIAVAAAAQVTPLYRPSHRQSDGDLLKEKRYQSLQADETLFLMETTSGNLWKFDRAEMRWAFIGSPRRAGTRPKGTYRLQALAPGELLILNTDSGEAWWTDGASWIIIDDPSTRMRRDR